MNGTQGGTLRQSELTAPKGIWRSQFLGFKGVPHLHGIAVRPVGQGIGAAGRALSRERAL